MTFGINTLPPEVTSLPWLAILGTWFGTGLVDPFRGFLAASTLLPLFLLTSVRGRWVTPAVCFVPLAIVTVYAASKWFDVTGVVDDGRIVIDEAAGVFFAAIGGWRSWRWMLAVPPLFGLLDRLKPWPLSEVESIRPTDFGVLLDDCAAGLTVGMALLLLRYLLRHRRSRAGSRPSS